MILSRILEGVDCEIIGEDREIKNITIDSRMVTDNTMFVCIKGLKTDGHKYIKSAVKQGAAAIMIDRDLDDLPRNVTIIKVSNSRISLCYAAANFYGRPAEQLHLIGVTGTKGKTSTTYYMEAILSAYGRKSGVIGTVETRIGDTPLQIDYATATTPDTVEMQQIFAKMKAEEVDDVVIEVSSHALALDKVVGVPFDIAIFTNLTHDHLDFHGTMENYRNAKAKIFNACKYGVVNVDNETGKYFLRTGNCHFMTYSIEAESDLRAVDIEYLNDGVRFTADINGVQEVFFIPIKGKFTIYNALGVIAAALLMEIPVDTIKQGLTQIKGVPGRIQSVPNEKGLHVIVDYAHSPDSLVNIISTVREFTKGKVITVFGCGGDRDREKRPIMGRIAGELSDYVVITSDNPRTESPDRIIDEIERGIVETNCPYIKIVDRKNAIFKAIAEAEKGDSVIIAGKGHENYQMFADVTIHFNDVETATEALEAVL